MPWPDKLDPLIFRLRMSVLFGMYWERLKRHAAGELLAGAGIAVGVALVFGVLVADTSIVSSVRETLHEVDGNASLELAARSSQGFSETLATRASSLPGVKDSAYLLRQNAILRGPGGERSVQFVGVTAGLVGLEGSAVQNLGAGALLLQGGIGLPSGVAQSIGVRTESTARLLVGGYAHSVRVRAVLGEGAIGAVAGSGITVALLPYAQQLTGQPGRVTNVLIRTQPGKTQQVTRELRALADNTLNVVPANNELRLVQSAAAPTTQSTSLFVFISVMVGILLAFNAMLLIAAERRRTIADLRVQGYDSKQVLVMLTFQAGILGLAASLVGIAVGDVLAHTLFHEVPDYIAVAFPASGHQTVRASAVLIALGCGVLAAMLASMAPVFDLRSDAPVDAVLHKPGEPGQNITKRAAHQAAIVGAVLIAVVTVTVLVDSSLTAGGGVLLAAAALCFIPLAFRAATRIMRYIGQQYHGGMLAVALIELEGTAIRSAALAGIATLAIYGSFAVGGARDDLIHGLDQFTQQTYEYAPIWVFGNEKNPFVTDSFHAGGALAAIAGAPGIASVTVYQGAYLDDGSRLLWIRARPPNSPAILPSSQLLEGNLTHASELVSRGDWTAVSSAFADEHHLRVGRTFTLPTPTGTARFGVAAITTNLGWPPGAITINTTDFRHWWGTTDPTALAVDLKPGVSLDTGKRAVSAAIGAQSGLQVLTVHERINYLDHVASQGLQSLNEISTLLLLTAALALAATFSTAIYQRRARLATLKADGFDRYQLWRGLLLEGTVILTIGCVDGVVLGVYGHALADRYLRLGTGFPVPFSLGVPQAILTLLVVVGIALAVIALPGYSAANITTETRLQE
jgi:putative ABC transport system permease protein